ncbi:2-keto-4-pentenoate hydratase/2-oxohepta-3-ene-1,7-dioic acid hydratase (catechol pathway) [Streptomyces sp. 3213]|uniref:fumarylacetoacetate hydrolase family protein n=1 Tax=Streptomyces sp. 3213.3 TaxID=1855348 RepID=UPI00089D588B|nr:fumarylacetoacetate hydrolase family protein [Streptomyces sp. 3213.3]SEE91625.1 2-keto-4-pentenoate hydratase/2-oxohepta-3-ene-1,7-dioic acid hydratase (catechol pathway) [Streptomyces sp. 3213] [Streptomyces sp. 3213.3]
MPDPQPTHAGPFALGTFTAGAAVFPGLVTGSRVRDLSDHVPSVRALVEDWDDWLPRLDDLARSADGTWHELAALRVLTPVEPGQILQSGANYRKHVVDLVAAEKESVHGTTPEEARADAESMMDERARNGVPYVFLGSPRAISGPYDDIVLPALGEQHDWELELALVIGKSGKNIPAEEAMEYVAGYTISNDLTTRDRLYRPDLKAIGTDWFTAKNADTFLPTGPFLVPAAFVGDPGDLRITLRHNGVVRQDESTKDMIFDIPRLIAYVSTTTTLRPGDLLLTGSPAGNGAHWGVFLKPGDVIESEITGLGHQRNTVRSGQ